MRKNPPDTSKCTGAIIFSRVLAKTTGEALHCARSRDTSDRGPVLSLTRH